jgi:hypothetical protein
MEQLRRRYRDAQAALQAGRLGDAQHHVQAAGRDLVAMAEALARQDSGDASPGPRPAAHSPAGGLRRTVSGESGAALDPKTLARDIEVLMDKIMRLSHDIEEERKQVRGRRHWHGRQHASPSPHGGCLDLRR